MYGVKEERWLDVIENDVKRAVASPGPGWPTPNGWKRKRRKRRGRVDDGRVMEEIVSGS